MVNATFLVRVVTDNRAIRQQGAPVELQYHRDIATTTHSPFPSRVLSYSRTHLVRTLTLLASTTPAPPSHRHYHHHHAPTHFTLLPPFLTHSLT